MKKGNRVRTTFDNKVGISKGLVFAHSVWWVLVKFDDGTQSLVTRGALEVINENR